VFLTFDVDTMQKFWLLAYFPNVLAIDRGLNGRDSLDLGYRLVTCR
jgi:hypothetical protein